MGFMDKVKETGSKGIDLGKKGIHKGVDLGKKGVDKTKETIRTKTCGECKHYEVADETRGNCPIAGERLASSGANTCPQNAFTPKEGAEMPQEELASE